MNTREFELELENTINRCKKVLIKKASEYVSEDGDRLGQFYRAGLMQMIPPTEALMGMMAKHMTSVIDMCKEPTNYNLKKWNDKLGDLTNYCFLLAALIRDMGVE